LVLVLILIAILITGICLFCTKRKREARILVGLVLILFSVANYPVTAPFFIDWKGLEGTVSLLFFNLVLLICGIATLVRGILYMVQSRKC